MKTYASNDLAFTALADFIFATARAMRRLQLREARELTHAKGSNR
jgi:hypothetical protein